MKKKAIYLSILISLLIAIACILKIYSFQIYEYTIDKINVETQKADSSDRYIITNKSEKTYKSSNYSGNVSGQLTYEDFIVNESLVAIDTEPIPYLKYIRETDERKAKLDATLENWEISELNEEKQVRYYKFGKLVETQNSYANQERRPSVTNPYGTEGSIRATTRTIANYTSSVTKNLSAEEAWILAHERTLSTTVSKNDYSKARIDKVQKAIWKLKGATNYEENFGTNDVAESISNNLYQEAIWMREAVNKRNQLSTLIEDNMISKYSTGQAGVVSYNEKTKEFLVGPFSINYVRDVHEPVKGGLSEMISTEEGAGNLIVYSGIVGANVYGLVNGKEQVLDNWEFVYTDVTVSNGNVERKAIVQNGDVGDSDDNIYPYPNEEFYIKFLDANKSIEAITKLEFDYKTLNAEGRVKQITGTYNNVNWVVGSKWNSVLTRPGYSKDEGWWVSDGYYKDNGDGTQTWIDTSYWHENIVRYPNLYTYTYNAWIEDYQVSNNRAATLYQIQNAKIYSTIKSIKIKVGTRNSGYKYSDYCIPLTMEIGGTVWVDGKEEEEANKQTNGIINVREETKSDILVKLYNKDTNELVDTIRTDSQGKYIFKYVKVGYKYYVEFEYDWMKYKATTPLCTYNAVGTKSDFVDNPENYLDSSHAQENEVKRKNFNQDFYEIATDKGINSNGEKAIDISYTYSNNVNPYYQVSTVQEFNQTVATIECGVELPMQTKYRISEEAAKYKTIGTGSDGACAITTIDTSKDLNYLYNAGQFMNIQTYLKNINLGLIERAVTDFTIKNDINSITSTLYEYTIPDNEIEFNIKKDRPFDVSQRTDAYYEQNYIKELTREEYSERYDFIESNIAIEEDELQLYVLYEMVIKNESSLISGYITELSDYYDKEYMYPVDNDLDPINFYETDSQYKEIVMQQFMKYPSYVMKNGDIIKQVEWKSTSKYGDNNQTNLNKMYTTSLSDILLNPGEKISVFVYFKVNREDLNIDTATEYKNGKYIILDNEDKGKRNIAEINAYRGLDYVEKDVKNGNLNSIGGSRVDIDSNPGNLDGDRAHGVAIDNFENYEDDTDAAPRLRIVVKGSNGKEISGYVWEDFRTEKLANNQYVGNGKIDANEPYINDVLVELIRLEYSPDTNTYNEVKFSEKYLKYINALNNDIKENYGKQYENGEISLVKIKRRTGPQESPESLLDTVAFIDNGQYRFIHLIESGQYKVRFLYGDEEQLSNSNAGIKYNGHDYKSTEFKGIYKQNFYDTNLNEVNILENSHIEILTSDIAYSRYAEKLMEKIKETKNDIVVNNLIELPSAGNITQTINKLKKSTEKTKVFVLLTDRTLKNMEDLLADALKNDILVIVVCTNSVDLKEFNISLIHENELRAVVSYNSLDQISSVTSIYNRIINQKLDDVIFGEKDNQATDFIENTTTINGETYGRIDVMLKSQTMNANIAEDLDIDEILKLNTSEEKVEKIKELSNYKMSAESYPVSIMFDDNINIRHINLGLQRIPESSLELSNEVDNIIVTLSNKEEIINLKDQNTKNVQHFINDSYNIYMDEEIMQGAVIDIVYKINVTNVGEVDNLMTYLKYYPFEIRKKMYERLGGEAEGKTEAQIDEELSETIVVKVNKIYDYYDNLTFRSEDNNRQDMHTNNLEVDEVGRLKLTLGEYLDQNIVWAEISESKDYDIREDIKEKINGYKCVNTTDTSNVELYPSESKQVTENNAVSSISIYLKLSKTLSGRDFMNEGTLEYRNFAELIETYSINGRRDNNSSVGSFVPSKNMDNNETDEDDSDHAEFVKILTPFGKNLYIKFGICLVCLGIVGSILYIIKKKFTL